MHPAPRFVQESGVVGLGSVRGVDALHHRTAAEFPAPVADVRWRGELLASALDEVRADLEASRRAVERSPRVASVALGPGTVVESGAYAVRALVSTVGFDRAVDEFPQDRRIPPPEVVRDLLRGVS